MEGHFLWYFKVGTYLLGIRYGIYMVEHIWCFYGRTTMVFLWYLNGVFLWHFYGKYYRTEFLWRLRYTVRMTAQPPV